MTGKPFHNPFGVLAPFGSRTPAASEAAAPAAATSAPAPSAPATSPKPAASSGTGRIARAVVRLERSGRGGKEVTVVDHLGLASSDREAWLKALKAALGCGGTIDGETLVLQGDQRTRVPALLTARGVRRVTVA